MLVIWCLTRVFNSKIIEDEVIYNFQRFLVEDFFLPVIKPPETYFNNKLLPQLQIFEVPVRLDRNSKSAWRQSVLIFLRQTLHWKLWPVPGSEIVVKSRSVKRNGKTRITVPALFPKSRASYFRFAGFNMSALYYLRAWHRLWKLRRAATFLIK